MFVNNVSLELLVGSSTGIDGSERTAAASTTTNAERLNHHHLRYLYGWVYIHMLFHNNVPFTFHFSLYYLSLCIILFTILDDDELTISQDLCARRLFALYTYILYVGSLSLKL